jgi:predicted dehydrogenase
VNYFANGSKSYPKETLEIFSEGRVLRVDNFRKTTGFGFRGFRKFKTSRQDKGHAAEVAAFVERVRTGGAPLITMDEMVNVTRASFAAMSSGDGGGRHV